MFQVHFIVDLTPKLCTQFGMRDSVLQEWMKRKRGNALALAQALGLSPSAVSQWERVPYHHVLEVARITRISRSKLRPDIYPPPGEQPAGLSTRTPDS